VVDDLAQLARAALLRRFEMRRSTVPEIFARRDGTWSGGAVHLATEAYDGAGPLSRVVLARGSADEPTAFASLTMVALPLCASGAPLLVCDVVAFRGQFVVASIELADAGRPAREASVAAFGEMRPAEELTEGSRLKESWTAAGGLLTLFEKAIDAFVAELEPRVGARDTRATADASEAQRRCLSRMQARMRASGTLARLFGDAWVESYLEGALLADALVR
jgi:hypothetical protein